ncbi:uncharacterized protein LOC118646001 isoform X2 [Monomorium pharaonis]|nr:uncharacterized protein LOC118646001 isoform X2 [Monomorium pharaonis]
MVWPVKKRILLDVVVKKKNRYTEDVVVLNVAQALRNVADVVAIPLQIKKVAAQQENNLPTQWLYMITRAREAAGGCCMSGCCKQTKNEKSERNSTGANCTQIKDTVRGCCSENHR